jgi:hypothetical protein
MARSGKKKKTTEHLADAHTSTKQFDCVYVCVCIRLIAGAVCLFSPASPPSLHETAKEEYHITGKVILLSSHSTSFRKQ